MKFTGGVLDIPNYISRNKAKYIAEINADELAVRMLETVFSMKRSPGKTPAEALDDSPADWGPAFRRAANVAMEYWKECLDAGKTNN